MVHPSPPSSSSTDEDHQIANCKGDCGDDVIELSSDSENENPSQTGGNAGNDSYSVASYASSKESASSNSDSEDDLTLVGELREIQKSLRLKLNKFEKRAKRRKKIKQEPNGNCSKSMESRATSTEEGEIMTVAILLPPEECLDPPPPPQDSERVEDLKRKLEMVTHELSQSRKELVKRTRLESVREQVPIEVPEYPMEFYSNLNLKLIANRGKAPEDWFHSFNDHPEVLSQPKDYHKWILNRVNDLLPKVLQIITSLDKNAHKFQGSDLLSCRQVSKSWKQSTDKFLQKSNGAKDSLQVATIYSSEDHKKVMEMAWALIRDNKLKLRLHHPFPSRQIIIKNVPLEKLDATYGFSDSIHVLLGMFGKEVHSFSYIDYHKATTFFESSEETVNRWLTLRNWLENMPNLKTLKISFLEPSGAQPEVGWFLNLHPFPVLPKVIAIECRRVPSILVEKMINANPGIEKLSILPVSGDQDFKWSEYKELPNLFQLSLNVSNIKHVEAMEVFFTWPLRKLTLSSVGVPKELIDLGKLFQILETFENTLTNLELYLLVGSSKKCLGLKLPHLKILKLFLREQSFGDGISYDFLLPLKALENLEISLEQEGGHENADDQVIQIRGFIDRLYDSNIWKLFPCLKTVEATAFYGEEDRQKRFRYKKACFSN